MENAVNKQYIQFAEQFTERKRDVILQKARTLFLNFII